MMRIDGFQAVDQMRVGSYRELAIPVVHPLMSAPPCI